MLDPVALAWASWAGLAISILGTLVSIVGLTLTFREARRATQAAQAARAEAEKVNNLVRSRSRLSALSSAVSQTDVIRARISKDGLKSGRDTFTQYQRVVREALAVTLALDGQASLGVVEDAGKALERVGSLIEAVVDNKVKKAQMHKALESVANFLITQEARVKSEDLT